MEDTSCFVIIYGVLVDFESGVKGLTGKLPSDLKTGALWGAIGRHGAPRFFRDLPWTSDGKELWEALKRHQPRILTGVSQSSVSEAKYAWCKRELGVPTTWRDMAGPKRSHQRQSWATRSDAGDSESAFVEVITCWSKNKHKESGRRHVLVDDREKLRADWEAAGGIFVHHTSTASTLQLLRDAGILSEAMTSPVASKESTQSSNAKNK